MAQKEQKLNTHWCTMLAPNTIEQTKSGKLRGMGCVLKCGYQLLLRVLFENMYCAEHS